jgi:site-specific DNA-methyltransferase (adenine-specific)/adenine-specific DNA-methyltransferase
LTLTNEKRENTKVGEFELDSVHSGDSLEYMKRIPDESFDLVICDGPYGVTQNFWDKVGSIQAFNLKLIKIFPRLLKPGGALYLFGKQDCIDFIDYQPYLKLNTRIVWYQPSRLAQGRKRYTSNYDIIAYFSKGKAKTFNLEDIRVPQLVELEHRKRCEAVPSVINGKFGKTKFNPKGKNPGDVWGDIKQLTYKSKELVDRSVLNTIQKPEALMKRLVLASTNPGDMVLDPFAGTGTALVLCEELGRRYLGFEIDPVLYGMCLDRLKKVRTSTRR